MIYDNEFEFELKPIVYCIRIREHVDIRNNTDNLYTNCWCVVMYS